MRRKASVSVTSVPAVMSRSLQSGILSPDAILYSVSIVGHFSPRSTLPIYAGLSSEANASSS